MHIFKISKYAPFFMLYFDILYVQRKSQVVQLVLLLLLNTDRVPTLSFNNFVNVCFKYQRSIIKLHSRAPRLNRVRIVMIELGFNYSSWLHVIHHPS